MNYSGDDIARLKEENEKLKREIALQELRIPHKELIIGKLIGSGGFGEVYEGEWQGQAVAIKKLKANHIGQELIDGFVKEARTLMRLRHKHIVLSMGIAREKEHEDKDLMIVMEFMKHKSLADLLFKEKERLQRHQIIQVALDVAKGLNYLHSLNPKIIHRDLKCENILLYQNKSRAKISDFGTARHLNPHSLAESNHGTMQYMAPEMLEREPYDEKVDVYSFGIVLFAMVKNAILPILFDENKRLTRIANDVTDIAFRQLISDCCRTDPKNRPTIRHCLDQLKKMKKGKQENGVIPPVQDVSRPAQDISKRTENFESCATVQRLSYDELEFEEQICDNYCGTTFKAKWHGMEVVVKISKDEVIKRWGSLVSTDTLLNRVNESIIIVFDYTKEPITGNAILVLEYMKEGSLSDLLHKQQATLGRNQVLQIALDIASALDYLHSLKIIHGNINSANVLLYDNRSRAKIDIVYASKMKTHLFYELGEVKWPFIAPEIHCEEKYNEKADVFSFGKVLLEMATNQVAPFLLTFDELKNSIEALLNESPTLGNVIQFRKLVLDCCQFGPHARPSMKQCIEVLKSLQQDE